MAREAGAEGLQVLLGEDRGRHQHGDLLAAEHGDPGGAHRDLRLAVADVAADEAVHGLLAPEVGEHLVDGALLVRGLLEREARRELGVEAVGLLVGRPSVRLARGVNLDQLLRHGEEGLARLRLDALPRGAAQLVERRGGTVGAHVALHQVDAVDGQVEAVAAGVLEVEVVALRVRHLHVAEPAVDADAVVDVDHVVVGLELGQGGEEVGRARARPAPDLPPLAEDLRLGHERQAVGGKPDAARELAHQREEGAPRGRERLGEGRAGGRQGEPVPGEERHRPVPLRLGGGDHDRPDLLPLPVAEARRHCRERPLGAGRGAQREALGRVAGGVQGAAVQHLERLHLDARAPGERGPPRPRRHVEPLGRRVKAGLARGRGRVRLDLHPGRLDRRLDRARPLHPEEGPSRQVVGQRAGLLVEIGKELLRAGKDQLAPHRLDQIAPLLASEAELGGARVDQACRGRPEA